MWNGLRVIPASERIEVFIFVLPPCEQKQNLARDVTYRRSADLSSFLFPSPSFLPSSPFFLPIFLPFSLPPSLPASLLMIFADGFATRSSLVCPVCHRDTPALHSSGNVPFSRTPLAVAWSSTLPTGRFRRPKSFLGSDEDSFLQLVHLTHWLLGSKSSLSFLFTFISQTLQSITVCRVSCVSWAA